MRNRLLSKCAVIIGAGVMLGCASMGRKFAETKSVNFTPFADQTLTLLSTLNYDLNPNEIFLIRPYVNPSSPELAQFQTRVKLERDFLKGVMAYSLEIVNLSESGLSDADQVKSYLAYMQDLSETIKSNDHTEVLIKPEKLASTKADIAGRKTLLEALQAARPLILEFNQVNLRLIRSIADSRAALVKSVHDNIDQQFKTFVDYDGQLRQEKSAVLTGLSLVRRAKLGEMNALKEAATLKGLGLESVTNPTAMEKILSERLTIIEKRQEEIKPDLDKYGELKTKLDRMAREHDEMVRAGGRAILLWTQAHQKMANGVSNPAEWFGMGDLKNMVTGAAKTALP